MLLIFCFVLLLAGCVEITQKMTVLENGTMKIEVTKDMTQLNAQEATEGLEVETEAEICEEASIKEKFAIETEECEVSEDKNIVSVRGEKELINEEFQSEDGYFRFYYTEEQDGTMTAEGLNMIRSAGVSMLINIEMPGKIIATTAGEFLGNSARIDMLKEAAKNVEKDLEFIVISKLESATGETPWEITDEFITEEGITEKPSGPSGTGVDPFAMIMQGMAQGMAEGMNNSFQEESLENNIPEKPQESLETKVATTPVHSVGNLPATGSTNVFTSIWTWIKALF